MHAGRDRYLADRIATASPEQLILMLFDRLLAEVELAAADLDRSDPTAARPRLRLAQDIVEELRCSIDLSIDPPGPQLDELYRYTYAELVEVGLDGSTSRLADVKKVLQPVRDAWATSCCGLAPAPQ